MCVSVSGELWKREMGYVTVLYTLGAGIHVRFSCVEIEGCGGGAILLPVLRTHTRVCHLFGKSSRRVTTNVNGDQGDLFVKKYTHVS